MTQLQDCGWLTDSDPAPLKGAGFMPSFAHRENKFVMPWLWVCVCSICMHSHVRLFVTPPGSSVHGILQATILYWVAMPSSRGSSPPRD